MQITLNGKSIETVEGINFIDFITLKGLKPDSIVIEYNFKIVMKENWNKIILKENDNLEIIRFVGGG
ncbi:MAG: sulfur carrier protein ThiS [Actinobacteria bacterium]|nr:sulfur carrier protein ThiS [Actinomycetota bacterium]